MNKVKTLVMAGLIGGLAVTGAPASATAQEAPAPGSAVQAEPLFTADRALVRAGDTVRLRLNHGAEGVNWISCAAFVRNGTHPVDAPEGLARVSQDRSGTAEAVATIADTAPGTYTIHTRVGGSAGPTMTITVVR